MYFGNSSTGFIQSLESLLYLDLPKIKPVRGKRIVCVKCNSGYGPLRKLPCGDYVCSKCLKVVEYNA